MTRLRILYSSTSDLSRPGAERTHIVNVVNEFARLRHYVHLLVRNRGDLAFHRNVRVTEVDWNDQLSRIPLWDRTVVGSRILIRLCTILKKDRIDLIYERHNDYDLGVSLAPYYGIPSILELNGLWEFEARLNGVHETQIHKFVQWEKKKISEATAVVATGPSVFSQYEVLRATQEQFFLVPNGVDTTYFSPISSMDARAELGIGAHHVIGFVGDFRRYHGLEYLIEATPRIVQRLRDVLVLIVGDNMKGGHAPGPTRESLRQLASEFGVENHIWLPGAVDDPRPYIGASNVCVAPFAWLRGDGGSLEPEIDGSDQPAVPSISSGGRSLKILEYMACGKPIVTTTTSDLQSLIEGHGIGKVVPPKDPQAIADAVCSVLENPKMLEAMGKRARSLAANEYSWGRTVRQLNAICTDLMLQGPGPA